MKKMDIPVDRDCSQKIRMRCNECYFVSEVDGELLTDCERYGKCDLDIQEEGAYKNGFKKHQQPNVN